MGGIAVLQLYALAPPYAFFVTKPGRAARRVVLPRARHSLVHLEGNYLDVRGSWMRGEI